VSSTAENFAGGGDAEGELRCETARRDQVVRATFFVSVLFCVFEKKKEMKIKGARWKK
jgi:hypothetical protein